MKRLIMHLSTSHRNVLIYSLPVNKQCNHFKETKAGLCQVTQCAFLFCLKYARVIPKHAQMILKEEEQYITHLDF